MLASGTRLGPYEIVAPIGSGGMGEVFKARDTRLDRTVAIKILPAEFSHDGHFRIRLEREAKTISQLSHPHICALYDVGQHDGVDYLVMEFVEGESLADRLARGPMPVEQVMRYGVQIAEALHRAHRQGIVHRDLKPANVMIAKSGVKLLDFGLAKPTAPFSPTERRDDGATEHKPLTAEGTIVGTFQYMAPEQIEGRDADVRSDIFALGATLYEMATGKRAFDGKSRASVIAAVLDRDPPPISSVQPMTPAAFDRLVRTCLAKDPDERWQSAHDVAAELKWMLQSSSEATAVRAPHRLSRKAVWAGVGVLTGLVIGSVATMAIRREPSRSPTTRFAVSVPATQPVRIGSNLSLAISPDGRRIAYRTGEENNASLAVRDLGQFTARILPNTSEPASLTFSPDGEWLAFNGAGRLQKVPAGGGAAVALADSVGGALGVTWYGDTIYYNKSFSGGIWAVGANGGESRLVIKPDLAKKHRAVVWPDVLPGGKALLVTAWTGGSWDEAKLIVHSLETGDSKIVVDGGSNGRYVESGHIVFGRNGTLYAVPFDADSLQTKGQAVPVISGVTSGVQNGDVHFGVSRNGTLAYIPGGLVLRQRSLLWVDRNGHETPVVPTKRPYADPALGAHGQIAVTIETSTFDIWQLDPERDSLSRVSFGGDDAGAVWTPDGRRIIWWSTRTGPANIYWRAADSSDTEERLISSERTQRPNDISRDGSFLLYTEVSPETKEDIWVLPLTGTDRKARPFLITPFEEAGASFSSDGRWVIYRSDESGRSEIYVRPFPGPGGKWQISTDGGHGSGFARNGREIFYRKGRQFFVVPIQTDPVFRPGKAQLMFERDYGESWNIGRTDQEFLVSKRDAPDTVTEMHVVLNWFEELGRRVPAK